MSSTSPVITTSSRPSSSAVQAFSLHSSAFTSTLPDAYNCNSDTTGVNPPLFWVYPPAGTAVFALLMGSYQLNADGLEVAVGFDWGVYNIAANVSSVDANCSSPSMTTCGIAGSAWSNGHTDTKPNFFYRPPCSQDCQLKNYTLTLFALSTSIPWPPHSLSNFNLSVLVQKPGVTLGTATMMVSSLRTKGCTGAAPSMMFTGSPQSEASLETTPFPSSGSSNNGEDFIFTHFSSVINIFFHFI